MEWSPSHLAHQLAGDVGGVSGSETLSPRPKSVGAHRQHSGGLLHQPPRRSAVVSYINQQGGLRSHPLYRLAHQILVWSQGKLLSLRAVYIPGHLNVGADILSRQGPRPREWMLHAEVGTQIWSVFGQAQVDLFATRETSQCPLWYSLVHPAPLGLDFRPTTHLLVDSQWADTPWLRIPPWDLAVVLEALCRPPFEPIEEISDRHLTLKTVFLLAITSLKRVGDLQAFSVAPTHLDFAPGMAKAFLYPRAGYIPKVPSFTPQPVVLQVFSPPPFREPDQQKLNCMCPVRALDTYVHRASPPIASLLWSP